MNKLIVYGLGSTGKNIVSQFLKNKLKVLAIIDNNYK